MTPENPDSLVGKGKEVTLADIARRLAQLKLFESDLRNDEVDRAIQAIHRIIDPRFQWFQDRDIVLAYHGSLQYHDPRNLDVDLDFVSTGLEYPIIKEMDTELENAFTQTGVWPRQPCSTNFGIRSIADIDKGLFLLAEEGIGSDEEYDKEALEEYGIYPETQASVILSSALLYDIQKPQVEALQLQVRERLLKSRWLREGVYHVLDEAIVIRQQRRLKLP